MTSEETPTTEGQSSSEDLSQSYDSDPFEGLLDDTIDMSFLPSCPVFLYHYTSSDGLHKIVEGGSLMFSDARFLNDGSEGQWGLQIIKNAIGAVAREKSTVEQKIIEELVYTLQKSFDDFNPYVFCMSEENNLLNQWRDYGKDASPYSIELPIKDIYYWSSYNFPVTLCKMVYDGQIQFDLAYSLFARMLPIIIGEVIKFEDNKDVKSQIFAAVSDQLCWLNLRFKNDAFSGEREWRLAVRDIHGVKPMFRPSNLGVVPYMLWRRKDGSRKLPISSVTVGPSPHAHVTNVALKLFLQANDYDVETFYSMIPIR